MAVRRERVVLELEDRFSGPLGRPIAAAQVLDRTLNDLDKSAVRAERSQTKVATSTTKTGRAASGASREIDRMSGRVRLLADAALLLGPALIPIGAIGIPALTGLASAGGAAALGIGTMVAAFQGVGDALGAVNDAALDPTTENLEAARLAMQRLGPEARQLVLQIQEMRPAFTALRDAAAAGLFPGLSTALGDLDTVLPRVERILGAVGDAAGDVSAEFASGIAGPRGQEFLAFVQAEMPRALTELGRTAGNVAAGLAELWMAFAPLNRDVSGWLLSASRAFDDWASGLSETQGFREFITYIREAGPQVADAMGAIGNAVLQIVQAAAPLGGPTLAALEAVADVIGALADSSYGPALVALATGLTLVSRAAKTLTAIKASSLFTGLSAAASGTAGSLTKMQGAGLAAAAGLTAATVAGNALVDLFREDLPGVEQLTGMLMDLGSGGVGSLPAEFDSLGASIERITNPSFLKGQRTSDALTGLLGTEGRTLANATDEVEALEAAMIGVLNLQGPKAAEDTFAALAKDAGLSADQIAKLRDLMPGYIDALAGAENQAKATGDAAAEGAGKAANSFNRARTAAQRFHDAIAAVNRLLEGRASVRDYEQAIDDLSKSVRQNGRTLDITTGKGRENQAALDAIAAAAVNMTKDMNRTNAIKVLTSARKDMIDAAMKLGKTRAEAAALADRLLGLDKMNVRPTITVDDSGAVSTISAVERWLNILDGQRATTYIDTIRTGARRVPGLQMAEGGTIPGPRYPYGDKVLLFGAPGEEVITNRNGEADRFRRDRAAGRIPAYADGGQVAAMNRAPAMLAASGAGRVSVNLSNLTVSGTLDTPWGPARIDGIATAAANRVLNAQQSHDDLMREPR